MRSLTKLSILACIFLTTALSAWQSKPIDYTKCRKDGKSDQRCEKENRDDNISTFSSELSTSSFPVFNDFTADQKDRAMRYADNNNMSPDDAVAKVAGKR